VARAEVEGPGVSLSLLEVGLVSGILSGVLLALISTGFNLSLGISRVINLQHGAAILWAMYGAFFAWRLLQVGPLLALLVLVPPAFVLGYVLHRFLGERALTIPEDSQILFSLGLLIFFQYLALFLFTTDARSLQTPFLSGTIIQGDVVIEYAQLFAGAASVVVLGALHLVLRKTDLGRYLHACAQNPTGARSSGLNVRHLSAVAMGISAASGAVAGVANATLVPAYPDRAFEFTVLAIVVSVFGGLGSIVGSLLGGLVVGIILSLCQVLGYGAIGQAVVYGLVFLIFLVRPTGLIGAGANGG
jgi:branched-chain amino acid transport system permease protein